MHEILQAHSFHVPQLQLYLNFHHIANKQVSFDLQMLGQNFHDIHLYHHNSRDRFHNHHRDPKYRGMNHIQVPFLIWKTLLLKFDNNFRIMTR